MQRATLSLVLLISSVLAQQYNLVWSDEFNGNSLDLSKWEYEVDCWGGGNNEQQCYTSRSQNVRVEGGRLILQAVKGQYQGSNAGCTNNNENSCTWTRPFTSGRVHSKFSNGASWKYGKILARAKLPNGAFLWPAIWMLPSDTVYGGWAASGEIDIMEARGQELSTIEGTLHFGGSWPNNVYEGSGKTGVGFNMAADFHDYSVVWTPGQMEWFVDSNRFRVATLERSFFSGKGSNPYKQNRQPFDQRFHMLLNLAVGGGFFPAGQYGNIDGNTGNNWGKNTLEVDHVRVYQLGNAPPPPNNTPTPVPVPVPVPSSCTQVGGGTGSGLQAQYYSDSNLGNLVRTVVDPTIGYDWGQGSPAPGVPADRFSVRWQGQIQTRMSGPWTFQSTSDDGVRVWVNNALIIDKWRDQGSTSYTGVINLNAGTKYPFKVEYYDATAGALIFVKWSHPCATAFVLPPAAQLYPTVSTATVRDSACISFVGTGNGLTGKYYSVQTSVVSTPIKVNITQYPSKFDNETTSGWKLVDGFQNKTQWTVDKLISEQTDIAIDFESDILNGTVRNFYANWTGFIQPQVQGDYKFFTDSSSGIRLIVNGKVLIDNLELKSASEDASKESISLRYGEAVPIVIEYLNIDADPLVRLYWSSGECLDRDVVSPSQLYTEKPPTPEYPEIEVDSARSLVPFLAVLFLAFF